MRRVIFHVFNLVLLFASVTMVGQSNILSEFTARQNGNTVELKWTFRSGETCNGTWVQHATDSTMMETINHVPGICGAPDVPVEYSFTHENPVPGKTNYYRLILGSRGNSNTVSVYVDAVGKGFMIAGQPLSSEAEIIFADGFQKGVMVKIFDAAGRLQYEAETSERRLQIRREDFRSGMHILQIHYANGNQFRGKLLVI